MKYMTTNRWLTKLSNEQLAVRIQYGSEHIKLMAQRELDSRQRMNAVI